MNQTMLMLNDDKTELIVFTSKYKHNLYNDLSITIGDTVVDCSSQVKDLVVIFHLVLSLRQHVSYTSKTCRFHIRNISRIRKYIPQYTSVVLINSLIMSRLDCSNGLFYGLPKCTVSGLQAVQNSAARIVTRERLRDHDSMSRALIGLHCCQLIRGLSISCCCIRMKRCMTWHRDIFVNWLCHMCHVEF